MGGWLWWTEGGWLWWRMGSCFGGGWVVVVEGRWVAVVRKQGFAQCTATIYQAAALFFKQIVEKLIFFVMRINSLRQLGVLPPIRVAIHLERTVASLLHMYTVQTVKITPCS